MQESGSATAEEALTVRLLTPVIKAYTAKVVRQANRGGTQRVTVIIAVRAPRVGGSRVLRRHGLHGGHGHSVDSARRAGTVTPRENESVLDSQVTPIWEGTTNVLSLDVLRVLAGEKFKFSNFRAKVSYNEKIQAETTSSAPLFPSSAVS